MRGARRFVFAAVVLAAIAAGARAEDPPPAKAKHENKVTPEAKAAMDKFHSLVYRPGDHGATSVSAAIVTFGFDRPVRSKFEVTKADFVRTSGTRAIDEQQRRHGLVGNPVAFQLSVAFDASAVFDDEEMDAAVETIGTDQVVAVTGYRDGKARYGARCWFDERGLLRRRHWRDLSGSGRAEFEATYSWIACGDRWLVETLDIADAGQDGTRKSYSFRYAEVLGVRLLISYAVSFEAPKPFKLTCWVTDLVVDGRDADLPTPWKHRNKVTPEAQQALERHEGLVYTSARHGVDSVSGELVPVGLEVRGRSTFRSTRSSCVDLDVDRAYENQLHELGIWYWPMEDALTAAYDHGVALQFDEADAELVRRDGVTVLTQSTYEDGAKTGGNEAVFDETGLMTKRVQRVAPGIDRREYTSTYSYEKVGDAWCVVGLDITADYPVPAKYECRLRYAEIGGARLLVSYDIDVTPKEGVARKLTFYVANLVVNGKPVVLPEPWKHQKQVTPEAKAAIERFASLVNRPAGHGLKSLSGALVKSGSRDPNPPTFRFTAGGHVVVVPEEGQAPSRSARWLTTLMLWTPLDLTLAGLPLTEQGEYDAEFVDRAGGRTLVFTWFRDGEKVSTCSYTFDAYGMPATAEMGNQRTHFAWHKAGDRFYLVGLDVTLAWVGTDDAVRLQYELTWTTLRGIDVMTCFDVAASGRHGKELLNERMTCWLTDVVLNGYAVSTPRPTVHESCISPEALSAIKRYLGRRYLPAEHGLRSLSGVIRQTEPGAVRALRFEYTPADHVVVTRPDYADAGSPLGQWALSNHAFVLGVALESMEVTGGPEFDADFVERDGCRFLEIAGYTKGARTETRRLDFDGNGLVSAVSLTYGPDAARAPGVTNFRIEWQKSGDLFRIVRADILHNMQGRPGPRLRSTLSYTRIEGVDIPTAFTLNSSLNGEESAWSCVLTDLVLNGKAVAVPPAPADKR